MQLCFPFLVSSLMAMAQQNDYINQNYVVKGSKA